MNSGHSFVVRTTLADSYMRMTVFESGFSLSVETSMHQKLGQALLIEAGQEVHIKAGAKVVLEAGAELTIKAGGSFVKVDPSSVTLVGPTIKMNSGGSQGAGSGWTGQIPSLPNGVARPEAPPASLPASSIQKSMESMAPLVKACPLTKAKDGEQ